MKKLLPYIIAVLAVSIPFFSFMTSGYFFGDDPFEYALSSLVIFRHFHSAYSYPYVMMSIIYLPTLFLGNGGIIFYSMLMDIVSFIFMFAAMHKLLSSMKVPYYRSMLASFFFAFSPPMLTEIGWGGQAQFLSLAFSLLAVSFFLEENKISYIFIFLSGITEAYSSIFGIIFIFFLILYKRKWFHLAYEIISVLSAIIVIDVMGSAKGISIKPLIMHIQMLFSTVGYGYFLAGAVLIIMISLIGLRDIRGDRERSDILALSFLPLPFYLLVTPYNDPYRIAYFIMIPLSLLVGIFISSGSLKSWKRAAVIAIVAVLILVSFSSYGSDLSFYSNPSTLSEAGNYINSHSLPGEAFVNVNIPSGWALESFSKRYMYYGEANASYMLYSYQIYNVLLGKLMSSYYYINSSNTYILLDDGQSSVTFYSYDLNQLDEFMTLYTGNINQSALVAQKVKISWSGLLIDYGEKYIEMNFTTGNNVTMDIRSNMNTPIIFLLENSTVRTSGGLFISTNNGVTLTISGKNISYVRNRGQSMIEIFPGQHGENITFLDGHRFMMHSSDKLYRDYKVKFAIMYLSDGVESRFYTDSNFTLAYSNTLESGNKVLIFEYI